MKKIILIIATLFTILVPLTIRPSVYAVDLFNVCSDTTHSTNCVDCKNGATTTDVCNTINAQNPKSNSLLDIFKVVINIISYAVGVAAIIMLIINGFKLVTSGGDAKAAEEGRKGVTTAVIGIAIVVTAQVIVQYVLSKF
ncbi:MAG TPA: pilin [Candidatus Saccharimonadales bacterium]|nr:pilin [Candidatus Saccharimonadales bacterium]